MHSCTLRWGWGGLVGGFCVHDRDFMPAIWFLWSSILCARTCVHLYHRHKCIVVYTHHDICVCCMLNEAQTIWGKGNAGGSMETKLNHIDTKTRRRVGVYRRLLAVGANWATITCGVTQGTNFIHSCANETHRDTRHENPIEFYVPFL